ncbi:MAG TPA: AAA domain-containing protein [Thermomicrobiales bacterium]|nr:AAA domain-containing protein [Thermomicrobiales bacterium]
MTAEYPVPPGADGARPISPTDVAQFVRLEQCERYLRLRLHARAANSGFMADYGVAPQSLPPLLTRSGARFEERIEAAIAARYPTVHFAKGVPLDERRPDNGAQVVAPARDLAPGATLVLFQPRLVVALDGWALRGDADIVRLERDGGGGLRALIADMKSSAGVKVEHRLQVAFYHEMLAALLARAGVPCAGIATAILYRGPAAGGVDLAPDEAVRLEDERAAAGRWFGLAEGLLEVVADPESYRDAVRDLVTGPRSAATRVATADFAALPYHLGYKCDGCLYNEFCMKWSAAHDDLSLLPHLTAQDKAALGRAGVATARDLAALKEFADQGAEDLVPAPGREALVRDLAATWPVGPRLDELIHRARRYRKWRRDPVDALGYIPSKGYGSLPYSDAGHNPNLVRVYIDAQHDYLNDRIYLLGALVVGGEGGEERPERRQSVVRLAAGPPETAEQEAALFVDWIAATVRAIVAVAAPDERGEPNAPIHLIFYNAYEQRLLLDGLARHFATILGTTPLYDFLTQLAAYDSPIATFLDQEIRELKNYPLTCQSLQAVAAYRKFDWNAPAPYRDLFRARLFDFWGRLDRDDDTSAWYTSRARFSSQIPLEYAYAAWGALADPAPGKRDDFAAYRQATPELLTGFHARRLEALEWVAHDFAGNRQTEKRTFALPDLDAFKDKARTLAQALDEFVTIERHTTLAAWKAARLAPPERRVLAGETLVVRYREEDQAPGVAAQNRENERRRLRREEYRAAYREAHPDAASVRLPADQRKASDWSQEGLRVRLRLDTAGADCDLDQALGLTTLREGATLVVCPRWSVDSRLPPKEQTPFTPTPKQMLYGTRAQLERLVVERDAAGRAVAGYVEVELRTVHGGGKNGRGFAFRSMDQPLTPGACYTLDSDPNDWYGSWCAKVTEGLCAGGAATPNTLYRRLADPAGAHVAWLPAAAEGQARFFAGLEALHAAGALHAFEASKRAYIARHGDAPTLLVQGPPGTGKSYATAFAVLARLQGALAAGQPFRAFVACKTHAATDVLLENLRAARSMLRLVATRHPELFAAHFDARLLDAPLCRVKPRGDVPEGVVALREKGSDPDGRRIADAILDMPYCVVAAPPGGIYKLVTERWGSKSLFGHDCCDCLVLDEASQMNLPEAIMAALPLKPDGQLIVVGDHRQMAPIVKHDWRNERRRTFQEYRSYESLFQALHDQGVPLIKFEESFRLHADLAEFLRREVYQQDGIRYHSHRHDILPVVAHADPFVAGVLAPAHPLVVVVHDETGSQTRNPFEQSLIAPILEALADPATYALGPVDGLGVVVPHRAQRAALQEALRCLTVTDPATGAIRHSAVDTVERFQGGERTAILVSATESDRAYLLASSEFLLDPRRLTVALSRARRKMILVASRAVFDLFSVDEETFAHAQLWKNLLRRTCTVRLWAGERDGVAVEVWGNAPTPGDGE